VRDDDAGGIVFDPTVHPEHTWMLFLGIALVLAGTYLVPIQEAWAAFVKAERERKAVGPCKRCAWDDEWIEWANKGGKEPDQLIIIPPHTCHRRHE
jgi:hypothetical protein